MSQLSILGGVYGNQGDMISEISPHTHDIISQKTYNNYFVDLCLGLVAFCMLLVMQKC